MKKSSKLVRNNNEADSAIFSVLSILVTGVHTRPNMVVFDSFPENVHFGAAVTGMKVAMKIDTGPVCLDYFWLTGL